MSAPEGRRAAKPSRRLSTLKVCGVALAAFGAAAALGAGIGGLLAGTRGVGHGAHVQNPWSGDSGLIAPGQSDIERTLH